MAAGRFEGGAERRTRRCCRQGYRPVRGFASRGHGRHRGPYLFEIGLQIARILVALIWILGHRLRNGLAEGQAQTGRQRSRIRQWIVQVPRHDVRPAGAVVGRRTGGQIEHRRTQGVDIRPAVDLLGSHDLFRRDVVRRAHDRPGSRLLGAALLLLGQTQVDQLEGARRGQHHVVRFDVPVHDALFVGGAQSIASLSDQLGGLSFGVRTLLRHILFQRWAVHELHHQIGAAVLVTEFVDLHDVRMIQTRGGPGLVQEAPGITLIQRAVRREHLDGDVAVQDPIPRVPYPAHPAGSEQFQDLVAIRQILRPFHLAGVRVAHLTHPRAWTSPWPD